MRSTPASSNRCTLPPPGGKPVTLAVIGAGGWGRIVIATARRLKQVRLAAVASGNPETDSLIGPETKRFDHWSVALGLPGLEAVFICTPPETHADITRTAVKAGLAVMVEKPLTVDVREAEQLVAVARAAGARVAV
ncbi:MAG: Gfo/Idh/MocA family protein, partial [Rhodospirillales bacterium]